ncbi:TonB-dependent receptor plug domain-containing protein [Alkalitalea saponilacus]|nr:TonB-dependent receptor [Alkalitalea saponilacus]
MMKRKEFYETKKEVFFKNWMHKNYAVFNTLNRQIKIGFLSLAYFTCLGYHLTLAGNTTDSINTKIRLDEIEINARRGPAIYSEAGRTVTILSRAQIETLPVQSVQDLLRYAMSIDVRERGPLGIQADVSVRGGSFDQLMVLLNGINISDPQTGHHTLNLPIDLSSIERVEILNGPAARIYGPNAFSGAINFITNTGAREEATVSISGGENRLYNLGATVAYGTGSLNNFLAVNKGGSDGYIDNTDFDLFNIYYHGQLKIDQQQLSFQSGYTEKAFGANAFYSARFPDQFENTRTFFNSISMESGGLVKVRPNLYWRRHHDRFELFRDMQGAESWYSGHNYHMTDVFGAGVNASIPWELGTTSIGGEMRGESVWSNVLGIPMDEPMKTPGEKEGQFTHHFTRNNASFFLEHAYSINTLNISAGILMNQNSQLGYGTDWFPGIDLSYWFTPNLKWFAAWNQALRLPTFTDLFYSGPTNVGNPDLKPEKASTIESGYRWRNHWLDFQQGGFYRIGENLIDWGRVPGEDIYTTSNINRIEAWGIEYALNISVTEAIPHQNIIKNISVNYSFINQNKKADEGYESAYVLDHLKHKLNIGLVHGIGIDHLTFNWNAQFQEREGGFTSSSTGIYQTYQPFWRTDFRINWQPKVSPDYILHLYAEATNLFDKRYADLGELYQPGRWVRMGVRMNFRL